MKYINIKTQAVIVTACTIISDIWKPVEEQSKKQPKKELKDTTRKKK